MLVPFYYAVSSGFAGFEEDKLFIDKLIFDEVTPNHFRIKANRFKIETYKLFSAVSFICLFANMII